MVVFAKVKYLITFAGTFYFFWLQVMGIIWSMSGKTGPSQGLRIYNSCDYMATSTITLFISFIHHQRISEDLKKKKKLSFMRVFIGQAALTFCSPSLSYSRGAGGGRTPGNSWWRCAARFFKSWPYFKPKISFSHQFSDMASKIHTHSQTSL